MFRRFVVVVVVLVVLVWAVRGGTGGWEQVISLRRMQMRVKVFLRRSLLDVYDHDEGESTSENTG